jgi:hypothetical protein
MYTVGILLLLFVFVSTLWGGLVLGPHRLLPYLVFMSVFLLPAHVHWILPGLPDIDRLNVITLPAILLLMLAGQRWSRLQIRWPDVFLLGFLTWAFYSVLLNQGIYPALARLLELTTTLAAPWLIGRLFLSTEEDVRLFIKALCPVLAVYPLLMLPEMLAGPFIAEALFGSWTSETERFGLFRPVVLSQGCLELGHTWALAAVILLAHIRSRRSRRERVPGFVVWTFAMSVLATLMSLSRGPIVGLALGLFVPLVLRSTRWLALLLGSAGLLLFLWMVSPLGSGGEIARALLTNTGEIGSTDQTVHYRFLQIDAFKQMVAERPILGFGEQWERRGDIVIIDGLLLIYALAYGYPGATLIALFWIATAFCIGRRVDRGGSTLEYLGLHLAPIVAFLTFSAWGDSFIRAQHTMAMSAALAAVTGALLARRTELPPLNRAVFVSG